MRTESRIYLEDFVPGRVVEVGSHTISAEEIIEFASQWDPQPLHTDPEAAEGTEFGGIIASGIHVMALSVRMLVMQVPPASVIAALGWDDVRFVQAVRPKDTLKLVRECLDCHPSASKPDRGVVRNRITLFNQREEPALTYVDTILVARRPAQEAG